MADLIYTMLMSLDGYVADEDGNFDWAAPDEEVHAFINEVARPIGTYLYGRRIYEVMLFWEDADTLAGQLAVERDFARLWQATDKVVYSRTLEAVATARTRLERDFQPEAVRRMKQAARHDISVAGPELAAHAFRAGLVDQCRLFVAPVLVGGGKPALPTQVRADLELQQERRFDNGMVHLHYRVTT